VKKCPSCGTVLDDSKKKCYMCGAELNRSGNRMSNENQFGSSPFNHTSFNGKGNGSSVNGLNVNQNNKNTFSNHSNSQLNDLKNVNQGNGKNGRDFYQKDINELNSLEYDDRSPLEKIFDGEFKKNKEKESKNKDNKPQINWGDNLIKQDGEVKNYQDKVDKSKGISFPFLFNMICLALCIIGVLFVYFYYIKPKDKEKGVTSFGGLKYELHDNFGLKSEDSNSRYYTYGESCAVRINYGATANPDGFVDSYFEKVKDTYANQEGYTTSVQKLTINDNLWSELSVQGIKENAAAAGGFSFYAKYRHVAIVYNGNYYDLIYANTDDNNECSAMYESFVKSLAFD